MKKTLLILLALIITSISCKKNNKTTDNNLSTTTHSCSVLGTIQDTIVDNGTKYFINAITGANNSIGIELINKNGGYASNLSVNFLQAQNGSDCAESSNVTAMNGSQYKVFLFGSFPSWAIDTNTTCIAQVIIDSTTYYLGDNKLNK